eukprot:CAMPEP_0119533786 /NCGR_PEP_ID=MMETSP1344-20130328/47113_1 /TAXON_ID=236787 /ORGANISM="Florenciella parvula, Strain CCMP2471" /LENGTH=51 /DNA_ID=CAMNT_0007574791 /DNA_START=176 /DNA_END=328 /DNA_ORIENTATION=-
MTTTITTTITVNMTPIRRHEKDGAREARLAGGHKRLSTRVILTFRLRPPAS